MSIQRLSPMKLWAQAGGDEALYAQLLREHGHVTDRARDADGNLIYRVDELAELLLLTAARFRSAYHAEHGHLPPQHLVDAAINEAKAGKVAQ
jgi:hypothetical protein